jgi:hypothetical protein
VEIVFLVLGFLGLIAAGAQVYYTRKHATQPSPVSPQAPASASELLVTTGPECRYLVVEGYTNTVWRTEQMDVTFATLNVDGKDFRFDGGDITPNRVFMFKGYASGTYLFTAHFKFFEKPDYCDRYYAADIVLSDSMFYRLKWNPYTMETMKPYTHFVAVEPISEDLFRQMMAFNVAVLPSCKALQVGVSLL